MDRLATRQVHLDFHTSECIPSVGKRFSRDTFQQALRMGHVNSITVFAKCHHGWCYYPTAVGQTHPHLDPSFDLTGEMVEAAHEIGVKAPIYITAGWSSNDAKRHPEWIVKRRDGTYSTTNFDLNASEEKAIEKAAWVDLCLAGGYREHILALEREICDRYPVVDGLFFDICFMVDQCYCDDCVAGMRRLGLDPASEEDAKRYFVRMRRELMAECGRILHSRHPGATIFFNGGANQYQPQYHDLETHFELEDLPTTWGGYDKMPPRAKYFAHSGKDYLGMTGKFHTTWGEFGGFKYPAALRYECSAMAAYGARCSIGDQLHPSGEMDLETYRIIGEVYRYIEQIEEYCYDAAETTRLGVVLSGNTASDEGVTKLLLEKQMDFDVAASGEELSRFDTVILPDCVLLEEEQADGLRRYIRGGGSLLLTGDSGLDREKSRFLLDVGAEYRGASAYENDYVQVADRLSDDIVRSPLLFYAGANRTAIRDGEVLAHIREPYFNRTYGHYCSHLNAPYQEEIAPYPAALQKGRVVYLAHKICAMYQQTGALYHKQYFYNALRLLYADPVAQAVMPSAGRIRLIRQKDRYVLHLLYAPPMQRGIASVIEDIPPLYNVRAALRIGEPVRGARLVPGDEPLAFDQREGRVFLAVPKVEGHQIVVLDL